MNIITGGPMRDFKKGWAVIPFLEKAHYWNRQPCEVAFIRGLDAPGFDPTDFNWPEEFTFHYCFACIAINYACNTYLAHKAKQSRPRYY